MKSDSNHCWKVAQKTNITDSDNATDMLAGYVLFGLVGMAVVSAANEEARKDPKNVVRRKAHDKCMMQKGYKMVE
jgi:hypothetical protein